MKDIFIRFLKDHHAFTEFRQNLQNEGISFDALMKVYSGNPGNFIIMAFDMNNVSDDIEWFRLSKLWKKRVEAVYGTVQETQRL